MNKQHETIIGLDIGGTKTAVVEGTRDAQMASFRFPQRWNSATPIRQLVDSMLANDPQALQVAEEASEWMGRGMALLVDAFNPQVIVLGSLAVVLGERILAPARRVLAQETLPAAFAACELVPSRLGKGIGDVASLIAELTNCTNKTPSLQYRSAIVYSSCGAKSL